MVLFHLSTIARVRAFIISLLCSIPLACFGKTLTRQKSFARLYTEAMFPVFEKINHSLWRQLESGTLTYEELIKHRWDLIFKALEIDFSGAVFEVFFRKELFKATPHKRQQVVIEHQSMV